MVRVDASEVQLSGRPPVRQCAKCKSNMEFDDLDSYFSFFRARA
jgi:hypothetical protein